MILSRSACTAKPLLNPGKLTSGAATTVRTGQNSGLPSHGVPASSVHDPFRIFHSGPMERTMVLHFGPPVCISGVWRVDVCVSNNSLHEGWNLPISHARPIKCSGVKNRCRNCVGFSWQKARSKECRKYRGKLRSFFH